MPQISVIVPLYNLEKYIFDCLDGLARQETAFDFAILVVDDASNDNSYAIAAALARKFKNLRLLRNPENKGLAATMKHLLRAARGGFIAYVDGDDLAYPGKLHALASHLEDHPGCSVVYHEAAMFNSDSGDFLQYYTRNYYNIAYVPDVALPADLIRYGCFINASSVMFRRHGALEAAVAGGCQILLDYPFHILNALHGGGSIDRIDEVYGGYRLHGESFGGRTRANPERRIQSLRDQEHACDLARPFGVPEEVIQQGKVHHRFAAALYFLKAQNNSLFLRFIDEASRDGWFFDKRQEFAFHHRDEPARIRQHLFGEAGDA